jgi:choline dehydrogenase-like flavoprotein
MSVPTEPFSAGWLPTVDAPDTDVQIRFSRWAPFTQRNLASTLGKRCMESRSVTVYFHANVTKLDVEDAAGRAITRVQATNFNGRTFTFSARHTIICLGVIESARLLLASNIGNSGDQVGRYFHDHIGVHVTTLKPPVRSAALRLFAPEIRNGTLYTPKLEATARWRKQHGSQAVMAHFPIIEPEDSPAATLRMLLQMKQHRKWQPGLMRRLAALPLGTAELLRMAYSTKMTGRRAISRSAEYRLNVDVEQRPSADSRITLSTAKDRLQMPLARLNWKITQPEERTVRLFTQKIQAELRRLGVTPVELDPALQDGGNWLSRATDTYHMMGGTRMGSSVHDSVVDCNLKVHDVENLYVASCSVFPSGGSSNPTFTMMALTLRLAEYLRSRPD